MKHLAWILFSLMLGVFGFVYDFYRFFRYGGWHESFGDKKLAGYHSIMYAHSLEKSLSYTKRNKNSGWRSAKKLYDLLGIKSYQKNNDFNFVASRRTLKNFLTHDDNLDSKHVENFSSINDFLGNDYHENPSVLNLKSNEFFIKGSIDPEVFFESRHSVREFIKKPVDLVDIERAVKLAICSPSVCNRQPWSVYYTSDTLVIKSVLALQNGNKPFGKDVPTLIIISTDLNAFFSGQEHYQHWIDGGIFSMSLMHALHSIGVGCCALNWSQSPWVDLKLRKIVNVNNSETIIMCLALGYIPDEIQICASPRKSVSDALIKLSLR